MADAAPHAADVSPRPTRMRHLVVFACFLMSVLLYLDRFCVGLAGPYIQQDLGLNTFQVGIFFSAFFLTYALAQVPSGWLSDRYGARPMLSLYILAWSLFTAMMGLAYGFVMLLVMRAAYGLGQAGAYPTSASVISKWVPFAKRGTASSIVALGGRFGGAIAPALTALLIVLSVPVEKSSLIGPEDILDGAAMCAKFWPERDPQSSSSPAALAPELEHVWSFLSAKAQQRTREIAAQNAPLKHERDALEKEAKRLQAQWRLWAAREKFQQAEAVKRKQQLSDEDRRLLAEEFSGMIQREDFYRVASFNRLANLDRAALKAMQRVEAEETLTSDERARFHRLLIEGCFPQDVGKIYVLGWRPVMITYGLAGLAVAAVFWMFVRNRPEEHPWCNTAEQELIAADRPAGAPSPHGKAGRVPWGRLLKSRSMWLSSLSQVGTNIGWVFLVTWFPDYLLREHQVPILERGLMASTPLFVGWLGMWSGGPLTDGLVRRLGLRWGRRLPWSLSRFVGMTAFVLCPYLETPWAVTIALSVVAFSTDLGTASAWAFCQDVGGRYVGSVLGWGNMWGNLGATVSPVLLAWVSEDYGWDPMFLVCAAAFASSGLFALGIDASIPVAPPDDEQP